MMGFSLKVNYGLPWINTAFYFNLQQQYRRAHHRWYCTWVHLLLKNEQEKLRIFCLLSPFHLVPKEWRCELVIPKLLLTSCWKSCGVSGLVPIHEKLSYRKEKFSSLSLYKNTTDITIYKSLWLKNQTLRTSAAVQLNLALPSCWLTRLCTGAIGNHGINSQLFPPLHCSGWDNSAWGKINKQNQDENNNFLHEIQTSLGTFSSNTAMFRDFGTTHLSFSTCSDAALLSTKGLTWNVAKLAWLRFTHEGFLGKRLKHLVWFPVSNLEGHKEMLDCGWWSKFQIIVSFFSIL